MTLNRVGPATAFFVLMAIIPLGVIRFLDDDRDWKC